MNGVISSMNCSLNASNSKQKEAFEKLSKLKVGALFMEMGTGKTKVALDLINSKAHKIKYVLWVCPFSIKHEIESEIEKWYPEMNVEIVGCESIGSSDRIYIDLFNKTTKYKTFMVVDESLKIKNIEAKRTKRILSLGEKAEYKLILNGTPVSKNCLDLWTQMEFLSPKILKMNYNQFKNTYCEYYVRGRLKGMVKRQYNIPHLISLIEPYIFDSELELNANKHYYDYLYNVDVEEYEMIKNEVFSNSGFEFDFFSITTILQQYYVKYKFDLLKEVIKGINGQVIVFVKYLDGIPEGEKRIVGDMDKKDRKEVIEQFKRKEFNVLYITYGCGSYGLNLQFCKHIIFAEHCFDYAQRIQAEARVYRIGQKEDVHYYNLWCNVGLENLIRKSLSKKENLLDEIKKEIEKKGEKELKEIL